MYVSLDSAHRKITVVGFVEELNDTEGIVHAKENCKSGFYAVNSPRRVNAHPDQLCTDCSPQEDEAAAMIHGKGV